MYCTFQKDKERTWLRTHVPTIRSISRFFYFNQLEKVRAQHVQILTSLWNNSLYISSFDGDVGWTWTLRQGPPNCEQTCLKKMMENESLECHIVDNLSKASCDRLVEFYFCFANLFCVQIIYWTEFNECVNFEVPGYWNDYWNELSINYLIFI